MIDLNHVTVGYGNHTILKELSATFESGKLTSVIGLNGCGKSTLLKTLLHMLPLSSGEITIDNCKLCSMTRNEIARKIAYLPQEKNTPEMTVAQMVLHGRFPHLNYPRRYSRQDMDIAFSAMSQVGIADLAHKPLHTLSGGMRQNAYIAMALAQSTDYILLDEPTTYLDITHQLALMKTLRTLADNGKGIIAVMHDLPMAFTFSDQIVLLQDGHIINSGEPKQVCNQQTIRQIFGVSIAPSPDKESYCYQY